ncbi:expressed unknown protein [Seminavis robusta]|uniref:Uncharacterized protein n=1 Tax=Seminavis robusta TaxID=568900 RepID=A0A9N8DBW0_9STRA|nr:expressed unknown protein [Seminavis robusta]|eukprot:Sro28_g018660.1 n/a (825) ;mRNA; f:55604-58498
MVRLAKAKKKLKKQKAAAKATEEEKAALVSSEDPASTSGTGTSGNPAGPNDTASTTNSTIVSTDSGIAGRVKQLVLFILVGILVLYFWDSIEWDDTTGDVQIKIYKGSKPEQDIDLDTSIDGKGCKQQCKKVPNPKKSQFDGEDLTMAQNMLTRVAKGWRNWIDTTLKQDYGDYYQNIFEPEEHVLDPTTNLPLKHVGNQRIFRDPFDVELPGRKTPTDTKGQGWKRMIRKYQIKLLQVQLGIAQERLNPKQYCQEQCQQEQQSSQSNDNTKLPPGTYSRFLWVNGGHSASAAHGNFYRESYTANLGRDLQPILKEIGLDWQVKNYAMGGTESAEEVALCFNSIFGKDVDSISWDYGMTDGRHYYKMFLYAYRAARLALVEDSRSQPGNIRHRPSLLSLHHLKDNMEVLQTMQHLGMTALGFDQDYENKVVKPAFPDMFGMTDAQISAVAPFAQYFRCGTDIEGGEPGCADNKWNVTMCEERAGKNTWHPGWRYHALAGHMMAFTILQIITESLQELIKLEPNEKETLEERHNRIQLQLQELDAAEQADYENIFKSPVPENVLNHFNSMLWNGEKEFREKNKEAMKSMSLEMLIKDPSFCHTAMLPAEIRYKGLLTENFDRIGNAHDQNYEFGVLHTVIESTENPNKNSGRQPASYKGNRSESDDRMIIGMKDSEHQVCPEQLNVDFKDYFLVTSLESWRSVRFPNPSCQEYYSEFDGKNSKGWVFFCLSKCDWGKCSGGDMRKIVMDFAQDEVFGGIEMEVNRVKVTSMNCMNLCCALKHSQDPNPDKQFIWKPNEDGRYDFRARITGGTQWGYARFSSFIVI